MFFCLNIKTYLYIFTINCLVYKGKLASSQQTVVTSASKVLSKSTFAQRVIVCIAHV